MKTVQVEPADPTRHRETRAQQINAAADAAFEQLQDRQEGPGVVQEIIDAHAAASMGLDTRRLCNEPGSPRHRGTGLHASLYPSKVTIYRQPSAKPRDPLAAQRSEQNLTRGQFNGYMSPASRRKFRRHVGIWLRAIQVYRRDVKRRWDPGRAYPTLATLTLPVEQAHEDREINRKCLQPFLQVMRREYGVELYAWRAEAQENGNLHYHCLLDRYVPKRALQAAWNMCIDTLDYRARYFCETGSLDPPSTNILAVRDKIKDPKTGKWRSVDPVAYLLDYLSDAPVIDPEDQPGVDEEPRKRRLIGFYRDEEGVRRSYVTRPIEGRVWGMSDKLREVQEPKIEVTPDLVLALEEAAQAGDLKRIDLDHATVYAGRVYTALGRANPGFWALLNDYHIQVFAWLYPKQIPPDYKWRKGIFDPRGLWLDLSTMSYFYPPTLEERQDAWIERHGITGKLEVRSEPSGLYLRAKPEYAYRPRRILTRAIRLGIRSIPQRWKLEA